jgi:hypothetical protein
VADWPAWWGELRGETSQIVLRVWRVKKDPQANRYKQFYVQVACYEANREVAEARALAMAATYEPLQGTTNAAAGLIVSGWRAQRLLVEYVGVVDDIPITGGKLYLAVTNLYLINLTPTS